MYKEYGYNVTDKNDYMQQNKVLPKNYNGVQQLAEVEKSYVLHLQNKDTEIINSYSSGVRKCFPNRCRTNFLTQTKVESNCLEAKIYGKKVDEYNDNNVEKSRRFYSRYFYSKQQVMLGKQSTYSPSVKQYGKVNGTEDSLYDDNGIEMRYAHEKPDLQGKQSSKTFPNDNTNSPTVSYLSMNCSGKGYEFSEGNMEISSDTVREGPNGKSSKAPNNNTKKHKKSYLIKGLEKPTSSASLNVKLSNQFKQINQIIKGNEKLNALEQLKKKSRLQKIIKPENNICKLDKSPLINNTSKYCSILNKKTPTSLDHVKTSHINRHINKTSVKPLPDNTARPSSSSFTGNVSKSIQCTLQTAERKIRLKVANLERKNPKVPLLPGESSKCSMQQRYRR